MSRPTIEYLLGKTVASFETGYGIPGPESPETYQYDALLLFVLDDGTRFWFGHLDECCEEVYLAGVAGDLEDLVGSPITMAEMASNEKWNEEAFEETKWTFYKLATVKGYVTLRFIGTGNGYYSISVDIEVEKP